MSEKVKIFFRFGALMLGIVFVLSGISWRIFVAYASLEDVIQVDLVVEELRERREKFTELEEDIVDFGAEDEINILLLGLDGRKGWDNPHCDAIHMFTLNLTDWTIQITSVPRGTYAYIPGQHLATDYYIANACSFEGLEYGIEQIEKVIGVKTDYYVTVGFSQVYGILRTFDLPTTESLQFLRHRQSYQIGDPQRSHNQAVFIKDIALSQMGRFRSDLFKPAFFLLFNMIDTDMDYTLARSLFFGYLDHDIDSRPDDIILRMRPHYDTEDIHLDFDNVEEQIDTLLTRIRGRVSDEDLSDRPLEDYQKELIQYLEDHLEYGEDFDLVIDKRLWLQIEDDAKREEYHFAYLEQRVRRMQEDQIDEAIDLITTYIIEKETLGIFESVEWAEELLRSVIE